MHLITHPGALHVFVEAGGPGRGPPGGPLDMGGTQVQLVGTLEHQDAFLVIFARILGDVSVWQFQLI